MNNLRIESKLEVLKRIINALEEELLAGVYSEVETPVIQINGQDTILSLHKENQKWGLFIKQPSHRRSICRDWRPLLDVEASLKVRAVFEMEEALRTAVELSQENLEADLDKVLIRWNYDPKTFSKK